MHRPQSSIACVWRDQGRRVLGSIVGQIGSATHKFVHSGTSLEPGGGQKSAGLYYRRRITRPARSNEAKSGHAQIIFDWNWNLSWNDLRECPKLWGGLCILYGSSRGGFAPVQVRYKIHKPPQSFGHSLKSFQLQFQFQSQSKFQIHKIQ